MDLNTALLYCIHLLMHGTGVPNNDDFISYIQPKPAKKELESWSPCCPHACEVKAIIPYPPQAASLIFCRSLINCHLFGLYIHIHILPLYPVVYTIYSC